MKKKALLFFLAVGVGELLAVTLDIVWLEWIFKPFIMITLGVYYYFSMVREDSVFSKLVIGAVLFSLAGDLCLMFQDYNELFFVFGLASFLIAHLCYILAYRQHKGELHGTGLLGVQKFRFALPFVLAGTGLIVVLFSHLGELKIPVTIYATVLIVMVLEALFRFGHTHQSSFWLVFAGAVLFMISDSLIAINKFLGSIELAGLTIIATYMLAQLLIIRGLVLHSSK